MFVPRGATVAAPPPHTVYAYEGKPAPQSAFNPVVTFPVDPVDLPLPSTSPKQPQKKERKLVHIIDPKSGQPVDLSNVNIAVPAKPSVSEEGTNPAANASVIFITTLPDKKCDESLAAAAVKEKKGAAGAADVSNRFLLLEDEDAAPVGEDQFLSSSVGADRPASRLSDLDYD